MAMPPNRIGKYMVRQDRKIIGIMVSAYVGLRFSVQNIEIGPTHMYAINPNGCSKGIIRNIKLKQDGSNS